MLLSLLHWTRRSEENLRCQDVKLKSALGIYGTREEKANTQTSNLNKRHRVEMERLPPPRRQISKH